MKSQALLFFFAFITFIAKAQIPNYGFEDWEINGNDTVLKNNWQGQNISVLEKATISTLQGFENRIAPQGKSFVSLSNTDTNQNSILEYGFMFTKFAYKGRPRSFTFSTMFDPKIEGESFSVIVTLTTANGDTISHSLAGGYREKITDWKDIGLNLNYNFQNTSSSDSCYLRFFMLPNNTRNASLQTRFYIDNLRFNDNYVSINEITKSVPKVNVYPNPANSSTTFSFYLNTSSLVNISLFSIDGKKVVDGEYFGTKGENSIPVLLNHVKSGLYIYKLNTDSYNFSGKLIIN